MKSIAPFVAVIVGVLFVVLSAVWGSFFPANNNWSEEQETQLTELGNKTRLLRFKIVEAQSKPSMHSGRNPGELVAEHREVREQYDKLKAEFEGIRDSPESTARILRWTGIALVLVGGLFVFFLQEDA